MSRTSTLLDYYKRPDLVDNNEDKFGNLHKMTDDFTLYVDPDTGDDVNNDGSQLSPFQTIERANQEFNNYYLDTSNSIGEGNRFVIQLAPGLYTKDSTLSVGHAQSTNFWIKGYDASEGGTVTYNMTEITNIENVESWYKKVTIKFQNRGAIQVGDWVIIRNLTNNQTAYVHTLNGCWEVTDLVGADSVKIKFDHSNVWQDPDASSVWELPTNLPFALNFEVSVVKSIIRGTEENGTVLSVDGKKEVVIDNIIVESRPGQVPGQNGTLHGRGIRATYGALLGLGVNVGVSRCLFGVEAQTGATVIAYGGDAFEGFAATACKTAVRCHSQGHINFFKENTISISGCNTGIQTDNGGVITHHHDGTAPTYNHKITNCYYGLVSSYGSYIYLDFATISNCYDGIYCNNGSMVRAQGNGTDWSYIVGCTNGVLTEDSATVSVEYTQFNLNSNYHIQNTWNSYVDGTGCTFANGTEINTQTNGCVYRT